MVISPANMNTKGTALKPGDNVTISLLVQLDTLKKECYKTVVPFVDHITNLTFMFSNKTKLFDMTSNFSIIYFNHHMLTCLLWVSPN